MGSLNEQLFAAIESGNVDEVAALLKKGVSVNAKDSQGRPALIVAAQNGYTGIVKLLLRKGAKVDAKDAQGRTTLIKAASLGKVHIVKALLDKKAKIDARDGSGWTPLMWAAELGKWDVAKLLISKGADINAKDKQGWTPLVHAFAEFRLDGAKLLVSKGAKANITDKYTYSPLNLMMKLGDKKEGDIYTLTGKGLKWVNPESILETESEIGSDLHKQLLIKTIEYLHEKNMFVMATPQPESFDLIAYPIDTKKKFMWDDKNRRAYEIQTSARKDSVLANADKKQKYNISITWVTYDESILEEIKKITEGKDEYLLIKM